MKGEVSEVRDIPAELWIKILSGLAGISMLLISFIGLRVVDKLDQISTTLADVVGFVQVHSSEISTLKFDVREVRDAATDNLREINLLKGKTDGR